ncbi:hypothetical protein MNBD_GAMMA22-287 [hydrothermal vent metagenome]|uniref:DUF2798 domain-containing protein n=1 Tax=hydrothermal vent metagenome TaxID=652676 RepID=A0A3B0ZU00_9ZZZZ
MLAYKYKKIVFSFFMSLFMSCFMSLVINIFSIGIVQDLFFIWLKSWIGSFVIAFPTIVLLSPIVQCLVMLIIKNEESMPDNRVTSTKQALHPTTPIKN